MQTFYDDFEHPASATLDEYLHTHFRPDVDFVDGNLYDRLYGEFPHSAVRGELIHALRTAEVGDFIALPSIRIRTAPTRVRVADLALVDMREKSPIVETPPRLCIEVLEPQDDLALVRARCDDFLTFGVPEVWQFDPDRRTCLILRGKSETEISTGFLELDGTPLRLNVKEIFSILDAMPSAKSA